MVPQPIQNPKIVLSQAEGSQSGPADQNRPARGRLVRRYFLVAVLLVAGGLIVSAALEIYFRYHESREGLAVLQQEAAAVAALKIERFIDDVETSMKMTAKGQDISGPGGATDYRFELKRLLFFAPAITDVSVIDSHGIEKARLSRLRVTSRQNQNDFSTSAAFQRARQGKSFFGPVYFARNSEPYMTIAVPIEHFKGEIIGVLHAEVNLKYAWDVVSAIKPGKAGYAYVVARSGQLVTHPDITLVLRGQKVSQLAQVGAAFHPTNIVKDKFIVAANLQGKEVISSYALIPQLDWAVFVERPASEVYATLYGSILRTTVLLLIGLAIALLASYFLARRIMGPLRVLGQGADRIADGDLSFRVDLKTGDEIQTLAEQFNKMTAALQESYSRLEEKVAERTSALSTANEKLKEVDKLKSEFLSNVSHELKTPLTAIEGLAANMLDGITGPLGEKQIEYLTDIKASSDRLARLIEDLLDLSVIAAGRTEMRPTEIALDALVREVAFGLRTLAKNKHTDFELGSLEPGLTAWADRDRVAQVLTNLIGNAIKFTPPEGKVTVSAHMNGGAWAEVTIADTGPGIQAEEAGKIFDEFYQVTRSGKEKSQGVGLGLAISRKLVEMHGGRIWVESEMGRGSVFHFTLPTQPKTDMPSN
jgi:signal transduction histidine kinase